MENNNEKKLTKWLNKLQQESWQLELVVSGFTIFLLVGALDALEGMGRDVLLAGQSLGPNNSMLNIGYAILYGACIIILINLILHVFLRGIWISTIGLRYVSGDIDLGSLRLAPKFDRFLHRKMGSFDNYIMKLENLCSVVFAFTFLIVFMLVALGMYMAFIIAFFNIFLDGVFGAISKGFLEQIEIPLLIFFVLIGLLYFVDFLTLGWLKRVKWLSHVYLPIYRFFSLITLSFLYRPLYYNLIDNKFGRRIGYLLVPYVVLIIFLYFTKIDSHGWYPDDPGKHGFMNSFYDDIQTEDRIVATGSIPSKFVDNGFLELFIAYWPIEDDSSLKKICPEFKPFRTAGVGNDIQFNLEGEVKSDPLAAETSLHCFSKMYQITVDDSLFAAPKLRFRRHPNYHEYGLVTILDVAHLERGEHIVSVKKLDRKIANGRDTLKVVPYFEIPFWKK